MLFGVNMPMIVAIPVYIEFFMDTAMDKVDTIMILLQLGDFALFLNSWMVYTLMKKTVTSIKYLPLDNKLKITQFKSWNLGEVTEEFDP